jgi:hypothetical protein
MSAYDEDIPFATKKSSRSGILFPSVGQYVGVPVDKYELLFSCMTFDNSLPFVVVSSEPHNVCLLL